LAGKLRGKKDIKGNGKFNFNPCLGDFKGRGRMRCIPLGNPYPSTWQEKTENYSFKLNKDK